MKHITQGSVSATGVEGVKGGSTSRTGARKEVPGVSLPALEVGHLQEVRSQVVKC